MKKFTVTIITPILFSICIFTNYSPAKSLGSLTEANAEVSQVKPQEESLIVRKCNDFDITGNGSNSEWDKTEWVQLTKLDSVGRDYKSKFKILASSTGIYLLFQGEDDKITTKDYEDMDKIWNGDVYEVFFHTDLEVSQYFEYEVNALEKQLVLSISRLNNQGVSWIPFSENRYGIKNKVEVVGGKKEIDSLIKSWSAEVFIEYKSLGLLQNVPPKSGTIWNANFYRIDHDTGTWAVWSWSPTIEKNFHELGKFQPIKFE